MMKKFLEKIVVPSGFIFGYLGVMLTAFIPIAILLLENGVETRIDRALMMNDLLNFEWFFGILFLLIFVCLLKFLIEKEKIIFSRLVDLFAIILSLVLLSCSLVIYKNTFSWLNDIPVSLSTDTSYTSNPAMDSSLPMDRSGISSILPNAVSSFKKNARLSYIKASESLDEEELRWEIFLNDANTYKYEGGNDFWVYIREYYLFLNGIDDDMDIAIRGFENLKAHVKDIGASVCDYTDCTYVPSTLLMLKFEEKDWRAKLWSDLISKYIVVALTDSNIRNDTRPCWLGSLPQYLRDDNFDVGGEEHLKILATVLWNAFNSFDVQNSEYRVMFYSDVPEYIVEFYNALSGSESADDFYGYVKSITVE